MNKLFILTGLLSIGTFLFSSHSFFPKEKQLEIQGRIDCDYPGCKGARVALLQNSQEITHKDITANEFSISRTLEIGSKFQLHYSNPYVPQYPDTTLTYVFVPNLEGKDAVRVDDVVWRGKSVKVIRKP